ncbi:YggT family protein [Bifidobacterium sp. 64T4]|uniref:YggT family protein n=1 Tax=Bifidobacterium pongonis TaxID=2834432 RepID=UPI001C579C0D|nr:YggT family protein [Bifidobacterium pongonis]MBW3094146.1 YggT family protein [Bifidobacterium pongonis]
MLIYFLLRIINFAIDAYLTVLFIRMLLDWAAILFPRWYPRGVAAQLINAVYMATEPPLRWLRRYIPPIRMGAVGLDVSFMVLYFLLVVLRILV